MEVTFGSESNIASTPHSRQEPAKPTNSAALFVYLGTPYPEIPPAHQVYSNQHLRGPTQHLTQRYENITSTGPSGNNPAPLIVEIPPYAGPSLQVPGHIHPSTSLQTSSDKVVRAPKERTQSSNMSLKMFEKDNQLAFLAGFISGAFHSPGIFENTNYGVGFREAVRYAYQVGLSLYRAGPNRG